MNKNIDDIDLDFELDLDLIEEAAAAELLGLLPNNRSFLNVDMHSDSKYVHELEDIKNLFGIN
jgi:hypothetical protein